jgi:cellulose synthase/poly-beta-1,6-N-acetylglucosamine synthase-like glycosyltransferase
MAAPSETSLRLSMACAVIDLGAELAWQLVVIPFAHQGKRSAFGVGMRAARGEIIVLADSDTQWQPGLLEALQAPFADAKVGGVGSRQNAYLRWLSHRCPGVGPPGSRSCRATERGRHRIE